MVGVGWRTLLTGVGDQGAGWWGGPVIPERRFRGYTVTNSSHWVFYGTGLADGDEFGVSRDSVNVDENIARTIIGYETDSTIMVKDSDPPIVTGEDGTPRNFVVLSRADLSDWPGSEPPPPQLSLDEQTQWLKGAFGTPGSATMGLYQRNGTVFTAGTVNWAGGLSLDGGWTAVDQITQNLLRRLSCPCPPNPEIANAGFEEWTNGMPVGWELEGAGAVSFEEADADPNYRNMKLDPGGRFSLRVDATAGRDLDQSVGVLVCGKDVLRRRLLGQSLCCESHPPAAENRGQPGGLDGLRDRRAFRQRPVGIYSRCRRPSGGYFLVSRPREDPARWWPNSLVRQHLGD